MAARDTFPLDARRAWVTGGTLLIASVVVGVAIQQAGPLIGGGNLVSNLLFSAALLVFAFGIRGSGSVTARRPLGTIALCVLALWVLLVPVVQGAYFAGDYPLDALVVFGYGDPIVRFVAALVGGVQIARAGVVPRPWNWAPTWAVAAVAALWLMQNIAAIGLTGDVSSVAYFFMAVDGLVRIGGRVFLGVLAIVLALRASEPRTISVYRTTQDH